jgi:hypothetical protein
MDEAARSGVAKESKTCFVVSAFGASPEEQLKYKQVLRHLVRKVLEPNFEVVRADQIDDEGLITNQIIDHLLEDDLVVADLTGLNANVFYEIAVRHAARKPIVHLMTKGQQIPFDVANMRAVPYALDDPDLLEDAQADLRRKVEAIEESKFRAGPNPVSAAHDVWLLQESEQPDLRRAGDVLSSINELRDDIRSLSRRVDLVSGSRQPGDQPRRPSLRNSEVLELLEKAGPLATDSISDLLDVEPELAAVVLRNLHREEQVARAGDRWIAI